MRQNKNGIQALPRLLNLIYPRRCPVCDEIVGKYGKLICEACPSRLQPVEEPLCKKCGKPLAREEAEYCPDCGKGKHLFARGRAAFVYDPLMRESVGRFKYKNRREYADFYVKELLERCGETVRAWEADALIPVPLHPKRKRRRGFNQAGLIAEGLGKKLGIPVYGRLLVRVKKTRPQKELSRQERRSNLKNAFQAVQNDVRLRKVILVDDIYTTGSTIDAAAEVLLALGVEKVYFLSICIGRGY